MTKVIQRFFLAACFVFISAAACFSATYWLPDYQENSGLSKPSPNPAAKKCEDFNMLSTMPQGNGIVCDTAYPGKGLRCYRNCRCNTVYTYTSHTQNLACTDSCTLNGVTKYKCKKCCNDSYIYDDGSVISATLIGESAHCGTQKEENGALLDSSCTGSCYRCVNVCGSGQKYCSETGDCASTSGYGCCNNDDCERNGAVNAGKPICDKATHSCVSLCKDGYSSVKPKCPNGEVLCQQEGASGCWGCCGIECYLNYSTAITSESCKDGQTFETQTDNEKCGTCKGVACELGYSTEIKLFDVRHQELVEQESNPSCTKIQTKTVNCSEGYSPISLGESSCVLPKVAVLDPANSNCRKCVSCEEQGQKTCGKTCVSADSCCTNGLSMCPLNQKCENGTCVNMTCEELGKKTCGTSCIEKTQCCTNGAASCPDNQKCENGTCINKTCEEQGKKTCGTSCIEKTQCCTNGAASCPDNQKCENGTCVADIICPVGKITVEDCKAKNGKTRLYTTEKYNGNTCGECITCARGFEPVHDTANRECIGETFLSYDGAVSHKCCKIINCEAGYDTTAKTPKDGQVLEIQHGENKCTKISGVACNTTQGYSTKTTSCADGQTLEKQSTNESCGKCTGAICDTGYSTKTTSCDDVKENRQLLTQSTNSKCHKCVFVSCKEGYPASHPECSSGGHPCGLRKCNTNYYVDLKTSAGTGKVKCSTGAKLYDLSGNAVCAWDCGQCPEV